MKKIFCLTLLLTCQGAYAQSTFSDTVKINDLAPPSTPAFVLLDAAPSSVEKPATAKAFTTSIINLINNTGGAAEFTPFWLLPRKHMTDYRFLGISTDNTNRQNIFKSLKLVSISLAVLNRNNTDDKSNKAVSNVVLGARTRLIQLNKQSSIDSVVIYHGIIIDSLKKLSSKIADIAFEYQDSLSKAKNESEQRGFIKERDDKIKAAQLLSFQRTKFCSDAIRKYLTEKPKFTVDLAGAANYAFDTTRLNSGRLDRIGIWANINWIPIRNDQKHHFLHTIGVLRYITNDKLVISKDLTEKHNYFDYGLKIEAEFNRLSVGFEYIKRSDLTTSELSSDRSAGVLNYRITDNVFLTGTFGKNFGKDNSLISLFGLQFNFGNEKATINEKTSPQ